MRIEKIMELQVIKKTLNPTNSQIMHSNMHSFEKFISHVPFLKMPLRMYSTGTIAWANSFIQFFP